jgi:RNA polymerase sigma factor for flagellar operon FliA
MRKAIPGSRGAAARRRRLAEAEGALRQRLGREPLRAELAAELHLEESELADFMAEPVRVTSLDAVYDDGDASYADDRPDPFEILSGAEDNAVLAQVIADLPERLKLVLQLYFVEELNLAEIASILDVSIPRVHQLKAQAIKLVRTELAELI